VLLVARNPALLQEVEKELATRAQANQVVASFAADVSCPENCQAIGARARQVLPSALTILVNNAGIYGPMGRVEDNDWTAWAQAMHVNCFGTVLMCREVMPTFRQQGYGKIINLSGGGATAPLPNMSAYAAAKAAVVRFTETLAEEARDSKIDVNAIAPGALNTRLLDEVLSAGPERVGRAFYERSLKQRDSGGVPLEKGADLTVFLASAASDGITGRLLSAVWDDWANLPARREELARTDIFTLRRIVPEDRRDKWLCA
jgi:3-oxoacyl-[acyl-carrier protein] reductase